MRRIRIKAGDRVFIVGATGSGKTHLTRILLAPRRFTVVIDPKWEYTFQEQPLPYGPESIVYTRKEVEAYTGLAPLIYRPDAESLYRGNLDWLWNWVWQRAHTTIYIDELLPIVPRPMSPPVSLMRLVQMGRSREISVWSATQRPARIPIPFVSEAEHHIIFRLRSFEDRKRMAEYTHERTLWYPPRGHEFWYHSDREGLLIKLNAADIAVKVRVKGGRIA